MDINLPYFSTWGRVVCIVKKFPSFNFGHRGEGEVNEFEELRFQTFFPSNLHRKMRWIWEKWWENSRHPILVTGRGGGVNEIENLHFFLQTYLKNGLNLEKMVENSRHPILVRAAAGSMKLTICLFKLFSSNSLIAMSWNKKEYFFLRDLFGLGWDLKNERLNVHPV